MVQPSYTITLSMGRRSVKPPSDYSVALIKPISMRLTDLISHKSGPTISFEMTRPKTPKGVANIGNTLDKIVELKPNFLTMTFGAGGGTRDASMEMLHKIKTERKQEVVAHLAGYGMSPEHLDKTVTGFASIGIENVLVIRGDKPHSEDFVAEEGAFSHASEMIEHLKPNHSMCYGASAYPEGHVEAESVDADIEFVKIKIAAGAEYIICQYFYDNQHYFDFIKKCRAAGITVPILLGVMPIYSVKMMTLLSSLCGATITDEINDGLASIDIEEKGAVNQWGIDFGIKQCTELINFGVDGLHFYTLNRASSVTGIINGLRESGVLS
ncbi:MAG: methylenetetrahydrofolate reductase (NADPH) [Bacteroidia bacterium]|jgi:methylenetetrahydrofolate reductase (NADPH)